MQITWDQGYLLILIIKYFKIVLLTFNVGVLHKNKTGQGAKLNLILHFYTYCVRQGEYNIILKAVLIQKCHKHFVFFNTGNVCK